MTAALHQLVAELKRRALSAFASASRQKADDEFGRRFIEHGAWCYANAAMELEAALGTPTIATTTLQSSASTSIAAIGEAWQGGTYAGITTSKTGEVYALVLLADKPTGGLNWKDALAWAKSLDAEVPNRVESAMLFANLPDAFEKEWHWTSEQDSDAVYAWCQSFYHGYQYATHKSYGGRVRAVRRLPLNPSTIEVQL
jgi:hypothetical protein